MQHIKRKLLAAIAVLPWLTGCKSAVSSQTQTQTSTIVKALTPSQQRLAGIGLTLVVDAVEGAEMLGVEFFADGEDFRIYAKSRTAKTNRDIMSFPSRTVPNMVRVVWRDSSKIIRLPSDGSRNTYAGTVLGDHTIPVASRIPDEVIQSIRAKGGGLRLKFRLKPDGVLFGWDIWRSVPVPGVTEYKASVFDMPGGDFLDTKY